MIKLEIIKEQINATKNQTEGLIRDLSVDLWDVSPKILNTNLNWQIGHVFLANYLHGIASISGVSKEIREAINVQDYIKFYGLKSNPLDFKTEKPAKDN